MTTPTHREQVRQSAHRYVERILTETGCPQCGGDVDVQSALRMSCPSCGWQDRPASFQTTMDRRAAIDAIVRAHRPHPEGTDHATR